MNIFLKENRKQCIRLLEFFKFMSNLYFPLVNEYGESDNSLILEFLKVVEGFYKRDSKTVIAYNQALQDFIFWQSKEFYRETMQKFVVGELNALEFAEEFSDRLLAEQVKSKRLSTDFKQQADIELNSKSFQFSKIILDFELILEGYQDEMQQLEEDDEFSENDLSFTEDSIKEGVRRALAEIDKYFVD